MNERWEGEMTARAAETDRRLGQIEEDISVIRRCATETRERVIAMTHLPDEVKRTKDRVTTLTLTLLVASLGLIANLLAGRL